MNVWSIWKRETDKNPPPNGRWKTSAEFLEKYVDFMPGSAISENRKVLRYIYGR